ncbi:MAG TPA: CoA transferase [Acidimicrobiales bacterium]|nr:CoA transferase [Acidimicrobiales bacterium]
MTAGALDGIRVLDLSQGIAGPLGVLLLAEHGADVIKVEPPGGDPFRSYEGYRCWNRSRRSVVVDLKSDEGRTQFRRLAASADMVVESFRPGVAERLGLGYEDLRAIDDRLILVSCPAYPPGHPLAQRPAYDALVQASSGQMWAQPGWREGPIFLHMPVPSMGAVFLVGAGALAALAARQRTGRGQHVKTSLFQGALLYTTQLYQDVANPGAGYHELMAKTYPPGIHQTMLFECAGGGWIHISVMSGLPPLKTLDEVIGLDDAPDVLTLMGLSPDERAALDVRRRQRMRAWDVDELVEELRRHNHAAESVVPAHEVLRHVQTVANGTVATVDDPDRESTRQMGVPIHLLGTPGAVKGPQPRPGEHTDEVLRSLSGPAAAREGAVPTGTVRPPAPPFALGGVRVIDFGQYLAGPFGPMILGDLGADVVKIEPVNGDAMRFSAKPFIGCQRGKRSLALDLKDPKGLEAARRLVAAADVVHHNMTRGVASRLGIDYAACRALKADIIYCNTYAYGLDDPLGRFGGLDPLYQASSGIEYEAGAVCHGNDPLYLRFGMCDTANAMLSVVGVLLALVHRGRTGEGQELWTSLHDGGIVFTSDAWTGPDGAAWDRPHLDPGLHGVDALYRLYRTGGGGWICIAAVTDGQWGGLCAALGLDALGDDARFSTGSARRGSRQELEDLLQAAFMTRPASEWTAVLDDVGVPNQVPLDTDDGRQILRDADNVSLGLVADYEHGVLGRLRQFGQLIQLSDTPGRIAGPPPLVGEHTRPLLREAGYRDADIDTLIAEGVAYEPDGAYTERFVT